MTMAGEIKSRPILATPWNGEVFPFLEKESEVTVFGGVASGTGANVVPDAAFVTYPMAKSQISQRQTEGNIFATIFIALIKAAGLQKNRTSQHAACGRGAPLKSPLAA